MRVLKKFIYIIVIGLLAIFLIKQGKEPWVIVLQHWQIFFQVTVFTGTGLIVQAQSFKSVASPKPEIDLISLTSIWSASAVTSVIAPFFAGLATRTILLMQSGFSLRDCLTASSRQIWIGLEFALLLASVSLSFVSIPYSLHLAATLLAAWISMLIIRISAFKKTKTIEKNPLTIFKKLMTLLAFPVKGTAHLWFILQILLMASIYHVAFNGMGGKLSISEAIALSSLTVIMSLFFFVPNGLGLTDIIWVWVATNTGLTLDSAVGLAILIRLAHLLSSGVLYGITRIYIRPSTIS